MKIRGSVVSLSCIFPHPSEDKKKKEAKTYSQNVKSLRMPSLWVNSSSKQSYDSSAVDALW